MTRLRWLGGWARDIAIAIVVLVVTLVVFVPALALAAEVATGQADTEALGMFGGGATIATGLLYVGRVITQLGRKLMARLDADEAHRKAELEHFAAMRRHHEREEHVFDEVLGVMVPKRAPVGDRLDHLEALVRQLVEHDPGPTPVREVPSRPISVR